MSFLVNRIVSTLVNPFAIGLFFLFLSIAFILKKKNRLAFWVNVVAILWLWIWATQALYSVIGYQLERRYPPVPVEHLPAADAIVVLGGGMGGNTNFPYAEMWSSADRAWHAARLYHAGKARLIIPSGTLEEYATVPLLLDLGVPRDAIHVENQARNTEENARFVESLVMSLVKSGNQSEPTVLLVTSAWHMQRALFMFKRTRLKCVPAATDHEASICRDRGLTWNAFFPSPDLFSRNSMMFKEWLGFFLCRVKYSIIGTG